jgi:hypothetical protein
MITEGSLEIAIKDCCHKLSANSLLVYRPGESFKIQAIAAKHGEPSCYLPVAFWTTLMRTFSR